MFVVVVRMIVARRFHRLVLAIFIVNVPMIVIVVNVRPRRLPKSNRPDRGQQQQHASANQHPDVKRLRKDVTQHPLALHDNAHAAEDDRHHAERTADPDGEEIFEILIAMIVRMIVIVRVGMAAMIVLFQFDGHNFCSGEITSLRRPQSARVASVRRPCGPASSISRLARRRTSR